MQALNLNRTTVVDSLKVINVLSLKIVLGVRLNIGVDNKVVLRVLLL